LLINVSTVAAMVARIGRKRKLYLTAD
jgi:hypothetical protein